MRLLRILSLALFAAALPFGCAPVEPDFIPPEVRLDGLNLVEGSLFEQRMLVTVNVRNPNNYDIELNGLRFDLEVNGAPFTRGLSNQHVTVPRLGEALVAVNASTNLIDLVRQFLILGRRQSLDYNLSGDAFIAGYGGGPVPFDYGGSLRLLPAPPGRDDDMRRLFVPEA